MSIYKKLHFYLFFALLPGPLFGQSLFQDVENLLAAIDVLEQDSSSQDSMSMAKAELLAILYAYDQPLLEDSVVMGSWDEIKDHYAGNTLIGQLVSDSLLQAPTTNQKYINTEARQLVQKIDSGPRQEIVKLLNAQEAVSPENYLSVTNTVERYKLPVFPTAKAMQAPAANANQNIADGALINQAAIIEGLFTFILDRAKDEILINFLDRLLGTETPKFSLLFPTVIEEFGETDYTYSNSFLERLRQAFYEDIQMLSVRLPELMLTDEYFKPLQADPVAYNLLSLYSMVSLSQFGMPVDEIVPATHRYLYGSYEEATKEINLELAAKAYQDAEYLQLITTSDSVVSRMKKLFVQLDRAAEVLDSTITALKPLAPNGPAPPFRNDFLDRPSYDLEVILGDDPDGNDYGLGLLPYLLQGELDSAYMLQFNTLQAYDKFFGTSFKPEHWRAAGIELCQKLNGSWYNDQPISSIFYNWQKDLTLYHEAVAGWSIMVDTTDAITKAQSEIAADRAKLLQTVNAEKAFWASKNLLNHDQKLAFDALANLLGSEAFQFIKDKSDIDVINNYRDASLDSLKVRKFLGPALSPAETQALANYENKMERTSDSLTITRQRNYLIEVENRLVTRDTQLYSANDSIFNASPVRLYQVAQEQTAAPYAYLWAAIGDLEDELVQMNSLLISLEKKYANTTRRARNNAKPVLQSTELVSNLMYGLRTDSDSTHKKWISSVQLASLMSDQRKQNAFLGLLQQRLSSVHDIGFLSSTGLAQIVDLTVKDLPLIQTTEVDSTQGKDSLVFFHKASFAINTLNRILETPLVVNPVNPAEYQPLTSVFPKLEKVPEISQDALDFVFYLNVNEHSKAIGTLIQLFVNLDSAVVDKMSQTNPGKTTKRTSFIQYLRKYGDFIAGLIDAKSTNEAETMLQQVAKQPSSTRAKRKNKLTVGVNAFVGANYGWETWEGEELLDIQGNNVDEDFNNFAPTMPVGVALSWLMGSKKPQSFSVFVSLIDVGGLLTFRPTTEVTGEFDFTIKNIFKPGVQFQWNIQNSPFYIGAGVQRGPQFREINGENISVEATRYSVGFGVDVPLLTLFQR
ncbi:MAG: hypothetical protein AAFZ15_07535 [Bacteroidota bacterium]